MSKALPALTEYMVKRNAVAKIFGDKQIDVQTLSREDAQSIAHMLACDLSPENLCCDGEAPAAYVRKRRALLTKAVAELQGLFAVEVEY